ncbi:protein translocase subunit SecF [Inquilinus limosus]|uniref:Protein-export membrane protein SecF n=1 Tax=Inquilinus limosus TaxID=171674 RepID=A0A211ZU33_9PROT|nr:protein translocase subunit SecF [Inquilinus limosus]OWJ68785.1 protein translocase subunit SecF [Inquilinus limosus]
MFWLRLVPDDTKIQFMRGRILGLATSAFLSIASVILFFHPGLNYGVDFKGGITFQITTPQPADFSVLRSDIDDLGFGQAQLQQFGSPNDVLVRMEAQPTDQLQQKAYETIKQTLIDKVPGVVVGASDSVGGTVSGELFTNGMLALGLALVAMLFYIWFRFEWQFGVGAVVTMILDVTKMVGIYVVSGFEFNLTSIAALLTVLGYSVNDKVVVYDRVRENLRLYKAMPLRQLIDLSINQTLNRTIGTSLATFLACLPLAIWSGEALQQFAVVILIGVVVATTSSIFIAAPILLFLGEDKLFRKKAPPAAPADGKPASKGA